MDYATVRIPEFEEFQKRLARVDVAYDMNTPSMLVAKFGYSRKENGNVNCCRRRKKKDIALKCLSILPKEELFRIKPDLIEKYLPKVLVS